MSTDLLLRLAVALAIGLIVGLERGWRLRDEPDGSRVAGLRTYGLAGLLGGVSAAVAGAFGAPFIFAAAFIAFAGVFAWFEGRLAQSHGGFSATAAIAGMVVFALGGLAVAGDQLVAGAGGVAVACLLASREVIHGLLRRLTWAEVRSALLLLAMTTIVLPVLPNRALDPWGGFNPFDVWLFTVLTAAISFAGYIAIRLIGQSKGTLVASLLGAVVSSTAVTMTLARRAKEAGSSPQLVGGALLAAMVSALRVIVLVAVVAPSIVPHIAAPAASGAAVFAAGGLWLLRRPSPIGRAEIAAGNPFDVRQLLLFGVTFGVVSFTSAVAASVLGPSSLVAASGLSAIIDVDAATLSAARLSREGLPAETVGLAILVAMAANAAGRVAAAIAVGPARFWRPLGAFSVAAVAAGAVVAAVAGP
ncbi:MAG: MgtC/SapB family protein [Bauldia sp.]